MSLERIRVLVADDHTIVRRGLVSLLGLGDGIDVVGEAADGRTAVDLALEIEPDVVLMDVSMPALNGLEAASRIKKKSPHIKVLILSAHDNEEYVLQVVRSGANGYLLKNTSADDLYTAIRSVHQGHAYFSPSVSKIIADELLRGPRPEDEDSEEGSTSSRLTSREREIVQLIAEGRTHQQIAEVLHISPRTVDTHCNNVMKKLDIHDSATLVAFAIKNGIVIIPG
jgi:DNA-binding NarL/FixJ family response regulator